MRTLTALITAAALTFAALPARAEEPAPDPDDGTTWQEIAGWTAVGLGGAAVITGLVFAGLASSAESEYEEGMELLKTYDELDSLHSEGTTYNKVMVAGIVAGLVAAVLGGHLLLWGNAEREARRDRAASAMIAPMLTEGGAGLAAVGRF